MYSLGSTVGAVGGGAVTGGAVVGGTVVSGGTVVGGTVSGGAVEGADVCEGGALVSGETVVTMVGTVVPGAPVACCVVEEDIGRVEVPVDPVVPESCVRIRTQSITPARTSRPDRSQRASRSFARIFYLSFPLPAEAV